ncbi:hypothetical protein COV82_02180 [Candidatus Peregrinibacteria bacterium CG11_big_fil_rev_8_21_14_0_20_46_8]|nr:MAG: hypothetical protein COV82_02180 [Candidatus Peregrinibacteria bacterium CG11_big_fil_rev_8_21_14_0_20_46_8]
MFHSIKSKLIVGVTALIVVLFSATAFQLIEEKKEELAHDIYVQTRALTELTTPKIADLYETFLAENSFVLFNRELKDVVFRKSDDIEALKIFSFAGEILYDSIAEENRAYEGDTRTVEESGLTERIKSRLPSYALEPREGEGGRLVYLKKNQDGTFLAVDRDERPIPPIADDERIANIVFPFDGRFAVQFDLTYAALDARVARMQERIILLTLFGILLGFGFAWFTSTRLTRPIQKLTQGALKLATGDFSTRVFVKTRDEVGVLASTFNQMAVDLQKSLEARVYKERVAKELELASKIHTQILPKELPQVRDIEIAAQVIPAAEVGGDSYDFISVTENKHIFYLGDVTGHGVPAGIVVSIANALIYAYSTSASLPEILINANRVLKLKTAQNMFMTMIMAQYDAGRLSFVSAGHPGMLHYKAATQQVEVAPTGGIALGMVPDVSKLMKEQELQFESGDCLVMYSDGVPEAVGPDGKMYEMERFKSSLMQHGTLQSADAIKSGLLQDVKNFTGAAEQTDDITFVVVKRR